MHPKPLDAIPLLPRGSAGHATEFRRDRFALLDRLARAQEDVALMRFFRMPVVAVTGPDAIHELLVERWRSFHKTVGIRMVLYPLAGNGLFTSDGDLWRRQRRLMAPLFQPSHLETYAPSMLACIDRWIGGLRDGDVIDVGREMTRLTMNVIARAMFDADTDGDARDLGEAIAIVLEDISGQAATVGFLLKMQTVAAVEGLEGRVPAALEPLRAALLDRLRNPLPLPTSSSRRFRDAIRTLHAMVDRMIAERRRAGLTRPDLMSRLLAARDEDDGATMSDQQVHDEVLTLFFAGHETTAVALTWALYELSERPAIRSRHEDEVAALPGGALSAADLPKLSYTLRVIKETLRLYPPAFMFDRVATEDTELSGYAIPRGTNLFVFPYATHRRPDLWPEPERFDPDRFLPEAEAARPRLSYLPFGAGPRICIGAHFSLMEAQFALAMITRRVALSALPGQVMRPGKLASLRPAEPLRMRVKVR
jgi:cytochrome P450